MYNVIEISLISRSILCLQVKSRYEFNKHGDQFKKHGDQFNENGDQFNEHGDQSSEHGDQFNEHWNQFFPDFYWLNTTPLQRIPYNSTLTGLYGRWISSLIQGAITPTCSSKIFNSATISDLSNVLSCWTVFNNYY